MRRKLIIEELVLLKRKDLARWVMLSKHCFQSPLVMEEEYFSLKEAVQINVDVFLATSNLTPFC